MILCSFPSDIITRINKLFALFKYYVFDQNIICLLALNVQTLFHNGVSI